MEELISIVMTSYNYAEYIGEAIQSVIDQTYSNWELIIVDDASTDNSVEIINRYLHDSRIKLYINEKNLGLAESVKKGINLASGTFLAFLESDDKFTQNSIEEKVKAIETGADLIFTDYEAIPDKHCTDKYLEDREKYLDLSESKFIDKFGEIIYKLNIIPTFSVVMVKKDVINQCNFNSPIKALVDWFLWSQLSYSKIYYLNTKLTYWRRHNKSYIANFSSNFNENFLFYLIIYEYTICKKNNLIKIFLTLIFIRKYFINFRIETGVFRVNLFRKYSYYIKLYGK